METRLVLTCNSRNSPLTTPTSCEEMVALCEGNLGGNVQIHLTDAMIREILGVLFSIPLEGLGQICLEPDAQTTVLYRDGTFYLESLNILS